MKTYKNLIITEPTTEDGDGLVVRGDECPDGFEIINCKIDLAGTDTGDLDENLSFVCGAKGVVRNSVITNGTKLILCGNGDYPEEDKSMEITFENCVFMNFGRRGPEAQDGATVHLKRCVIWNWGVDEYFDVRSFAVWAHTGAKIILEDCVLIQDTMYQASIWKALWCRLNHFGNSWNERSIDWRLILPGIARGAYATCDGEIEIRGKVYKNWWVYVEGAYPLGTMGDPIEARSIIKETFNLCGLEDKITRAIRAYLKKCWFARKFSKFLGFSV